MNIVVQYPRTWFTPSLVGGSLVFGDGYGMLTAKEPSNAGASFAQGSRVALREIYRGDWAYGANNPTNPEWVNCEQIIYDTPLLIAIGGTIYDHVYAKTNIAAGVKTETDGVAYSVLGYAAGDRKAVGEKIQHNKLSGDAGAAASIYSAKLYPYTSLLDYAVYQFYEPNATPGFFGYYRASSIAGYYYSQAEIDADTTLE